MEKTFKFAGVSTRNGVCKARFANDGLRVKVLQKGGHTDIDLVEFLEPLSKTEAVIKLIEMDFAKGNADIQAALEAELDKRTEAPKAKAPKAQPITMETIKAKPKAKAVVAPTESEDAPF
jgi:hypothetical protein